MRKCQIVEVGRRGRGRGEARRGSASFPWIRAVLSNREIEDFSKRLLAVPARVVLRMKTGARNRKSWNELILKQSQGREGV